MPIATTTLGAYPKPDYVPVPDWFNTESMDSCGATLAYSAAIAKLGDKSEEVFARAAKDVIADQVECGIDVVTDGEVRRENYIHYHCRHVEGFDFENLSHKTLRDGAYNADLPTIVGPIKANGRFLDHDWKVAQSLTDHPVKVTMPGALTVADTTFDTHYNDDKQLCRDWAEALNREIRGLAEAGCRYIQIDEPIFARKPKEALDYGVECLDRCWHGVPSDITKVMHMCCGYPNFLDQTDYHKADPQAYFDLARAIDDTATDMVSIEDAHRHNDLSLLDSFENTTVILGVVAIARSRVETVEEVRARLQAAMDYLPAERLVAAPDCGLGLLSRDLAMEKLRVMSNAAKLL